MFCYWVRLKLLLIFFFFQAEDGIRDGTETGVQTCALPISVMARRRMPELPGVPTTVEAGFPQWVGGNWWVLAAPHGTNSRIIERLAAEFGSALTNVAVRKRIGELGHVPIGLAPAATAAFLRSESARYKSIVELGGIKAE